MNTWYILDADNRRVWTHNLAACGERCFAHDIDAEYHPDHFGYKSKARADAQAASLRQTERVDAVVVDREELFKRLELTDRRWAHLKDQPSAAQRRRIEAREKKSAEKAALEAERQAQAAAVARTRLAPRDLSTPFAFV